MRCGFGSASDVNTSVTMTKTTKVIARKMTAVKKHQKAAGELDVDELQLDVLDEESKGAG